MRVVKNSKKNSKTSGKKKISLSFLEKKIISLPVVKKEEKTLLIITFLIFCLTLIIFWEIRKPQTVVVVMPPQAAADNKNLADEKKSEDEVGSPVYWYSFGDNFSSNAYLNTEQTNMYLDDTVSALMFPLKYEFEVNLCGDDCDLGENTINTTANPDYLSDLNKLPQPLPKDLEDKEIVAAKLSMLDNKQVASFVVKKGSEEQAFVYFLEDEKYVSIITDKTKEKIITKYGRLGGVAVAGGSDDNFIILYSGYEGIAYHYLKGKLYDASKFFGLRVTGGGFSSHIIKQGEGSDTTWYVVSLDRKKNRLIKLWQNNTPYIKGSADLSYNLSKELNNIEVIGISGEERGKIKYLLANNTVITFSDYGFDNSQVRQVVSKNINTKNYPVYKAIIKAMGVCLQNQDDSSYHDDFPSSDVDIYLGDSMSNFKKVIPQNVIPFSGSSNELFFRIVFYPTPGDSSYSPWLDNVNDLGYLVSF